MAVAWRGRGGSLAGAEVVWSASRAAAKLRRARTVFPRSGHREFCSIGTLIRLSARPGIIASRRNPEIPRTV